jgi:hypothetical protein
MASFSRAPNLRRPNLKNFSRGLIDDRNIETARLAPRPIKFY